MTDSLVREQELADEHIVLTGRIDPARIRALRPERVPESTVQAFRALGELASAVADALDALGLPPAIPASQLRATSHGQRIVGVALTLRNEPHPATVGAAVASGRNCMADMECHNLARRGDILVVQGVHGSSNLGGVSARLGKRQGELGAIVDGGVRDVADFLANGYAVWSTEVTPRTGKWRLQAAEINGPVAICGVPVQPGDLVVADTTGTCFVPRAHADTVLALVRKKLGDEQSACDAIDAGLSVPDLAAGATRPVTGIAPSDLRGRR